MLWIWKWQVVNPLLLTWHTSGGTNKENTIVILICIVWHLVVNKYCRLFKRITLTFTAWVVFLNTRHDGRGKKYRSCQKHESLSLHDLLYTGRHLLTCFVSNKAKSNLCTATTTYNITEINFMIFHTQNATVIQPNVVSTGTHWLLATNKGQQVFLTANDFQCELQIP